jgi:transcriptional regulator with XRE-family HTH domain
MADEYTGTRLKQLRRRARLTQAQVVQMCGVSETAICYLERGERKPQTRTLQRLLSLYAQRIKYWDDLGKVLNGGSRGERKVDTKTSEWR